MPAIPISKIRQNMNSISEFRRENRPISVLRPFRTPFFGLPNTAFGLVFQIERGLRRSLLNRLIADL